MQFSLFPKRTLRAALLFAPALAGASAWAQTVVSPPVETFQDSMSLQEIISNGGALMYVLAAMSVAGVALTIYFLIVLRANQVVPRRFVTDLRRLLLQGRLAEALTACRNNGSPAGSVARSALEYVERVKNPEASMLSEVIEGEGGRQAVLIQNQTQYLMDIGVIAPMVGLLGTVVGMLKTFSVVATNIAMAKPMELAGGVSQALVTTAAGLIVGIPAMLAYAYFRNRATTLIALLEAASADLLTLVVHHAEQ